MTAQPSSAVRPRPATAGADHPGPPLAAPLAAAAVSWVLGTLVVGPLAGAGPAPTPTDGPEVLLAYVAGAATATSAAFVAFAGVMLLAGGCLVFSRLVFLAPNAPGPFLAGLGGAAAGVLLLVDACVLWALSLPGAWVDPAVVSALWGVNFIAGGAGHLSALGLMVLGTAVTTLFVARTPRWLSVAGVVIAVVDLVCVVIIAVPTAAPLLPVARALSLVWLVGIAALVPRSRGIRGARGTRR